MFGFGLLESAEPGLQALLAVRMQLHEKMPVKAVIAQGGLLNEGCTQRGKAARQRARGAHPIR
jgi:hypothetical protein